MEEHAPVDLAEPGELLNRALLIGGFGALLFLDRRDSHQLADGSLQLVSQCSPVLGAVDCVKEPLGGAAVSPVHRGVGRGGQRHVGIREQSQKDSREEEQALTPLGQLSADHQKQNESRADHVEQANGGFHRQCVVLVGREVSEAEIDQSRDDHAVDEVLPEKLRMQEQDDEQWQQGNLQRHMMIAEPETEDEDRPDKSIFPVGASDPDVGHHQQCHHQADMEGIETLAHNAM